MDTYFYVCGNGNWKYFLEKKMIYLLIKLKQIKLEKEENVNFTVKPIPGDSHCIVNCFLARTPPKFSLNYGTNFRKTFTYTWISVNIVVRKNFSKAWKNKKQPSRGALRKRCSENMQHIYRRTPIPKCDFNKIAMKLY